MTFLIFSKMPPESRSAGRTCCYKCLIGPSTTIALRAASQSPEPVLFKAGQAERAGRPPKIAGLLKADTAAGPAAPAPQFTQGK